MCYNANRIALHPSPISAGAVDRVIEILLRAVHVIAYVSTLFFMRIIKPHLLKFYLYSIYHRPLYIIFDTSNCTFLDNYRCKTQATN